MAKQQQDKASGFEDSDAILEGYNKFENWTKKNKSKLGIGAAVIALGIGALLYFNWSGKESETEANVRIYPAQHYFGKGNDATITDALRDSLDAIALEGDDDRVIGFRQIARRYEGTKAGNLANFYIGTLELQAGNYESAISAMQKFSSEDLLLQARAYAVIGDCYMELEDYNSAAEQYRLASEYKPNKEFTPFYLMKLAASYEAQEKYSEAVMEYEKLLKNYPQTSFLAEAKKLKEKALGLAQ